MIAPSTQGPGARRAKGVARKVMEFRKKETILRKG